MDKSSGYPRPFCSFDGGDTTGSFLGPRGVSFFLFTSPSQNANRLGEYHSLYPCRPVRWASPSPSLEFSRLSCVSLLFMLRGGVFVSAPAGRRLIVFYRYHYPSCNNVAQYPFLPYRYIRLLEALRTIICVDTVQVRTFLSEPKAQLKV